MVFTEIGFFNTFNDHHDHDHGKVKTSKFGQDPRRSHRKVQRWRAYWLLMVLGVFIPISKVKTL